MTSPASGARGLGPNVNPALRSAIKSSTRSITARSRPSRNRSSHSLSPRSKDNLHLNLNFNLSLGLNLNLKHNHNHNHNHSNNHSNSSKKKSSNSRNSNILLKSLRLDIISSRLSPPYNNSLSKNSKTTHSNIISVKTNKTSTTSTNTLSNSHSHSNNPPAPRRWRFEADPQRDDGRTAIQGLSYLTQVSTSHTSPLRLFIPLPFDERTPSTPEPTSPIQGSSLPPCPPNVTLLRNTDSQCLACIAESRCQ